MHTDSEITVISATRSSPGRLYKTVLYLMIPLGISATLLPMCGRFRAYAQVYQLEQQPQSELDARQPRAKKFNTNGNGRMILSQTADQNNNRPTGALVCTSIISRTRTFRARLADVVGPSPGKPIVTPYSDITYLLDCQECDDDEQIYCNL